MYVVSLGLKLYLNLLSYFRSNVCGVVSLGLQLYLHLLSYFRSNVCGISGPPALLTSIVIFPFQCMWYLWASSFTYIYCHISVPMYVVSLGLQLYLHLLSYFLSNVCTINHYLLGAVVIKWLCSIPCQFIKKYFFSIKLCHAHLQYVCNTYLQSVETIQWKL